MGLFDSFKNIVKNVTPQTNFEDRLKEDNVNILKIYTEQVTLINNLENKYEIMSDFELKSQTDILKQRIQNGETLDMLLTDAFAIIREVSFRILELRHYDVQLIAGISLYNNYLIEMQTGEGKTLVAILPIYLHALLGKGAFIVTTNDYLARRDGELMGQVFKFLG